MVRLNSIEMKMEGSSGTVSQHTKDGGSLLSKSRNVGGLRCGVYRHCTKERSTKIAVTLSVLLLATFANEGVAFINHPSSCRIAQNKCEFPQYVAVYYPISGCVT